jgi:recombination protein RecA
MKSAKLSRLPNVLRKLQGEFGSTGVSLGRSVPPTNVISSGSLSVDAALGVGGLPRGRIIEISGPASSGKTTLALHAIAEAQKRGGVAAFIDAEHALEPQYASDLGVDLDHLVVAQPADGVQALQIARLLIESEVIDLLVIDSVAALVGSNERNSTIGEGPYNEQAQLMSQALRILLSPLKQSNTCLIFTNQLRTKSDICFGNPETTPGGRALSHYASVRMEVRRTSAIKHGDAVVGARVTINITKNRVGPPFQQTAVDIHFGKGISRETELLDLGLKHEVVIRRGIQFLYAGTPIGNDRDAVCRTLCDNNSLATALELSLKERLPSFTG